MHNVTLTSLVAILSMLLLAPTAWARGFGGGGHSFGGGGGFGGGGRSFGGGGGEHSFGGGGGERSFGGGGGGERSFGGGGGGERSFGGGGGGERSFGGGGGGERSYGGGGQRSYGGGGGFSGNMNRSGGSSFSRPQNYARPSDSQLHSFLGLPADGGMAHSGGMRPGQGGQGTNMRPGQGGHGVNPNPGPGPRPGPNPGPGPRPGPNPGPGPRPGPGPGPHPGPGPGPHPGPGPGPHPGPGPGPHPGPWNNNHGNWNNNHFNNTQINNIQNNFYGWGGYHGFCPYTAGWWGMNAGMAWTCFGLTVGTYALASFATLSQWFDATPVVVQQPIPYDYGTKIYYGGDTVYVNSQPTATVTQYYQQTSALAAQGAPDTKANVDADWLPLGVFAIMAPNATNTSLTVQLAVNKQGILRGNQFNLATGTNAIIKGSVDRTSQRVAWTAGADTTTVYETGLDNLTKDQSTMMIQYGTDSAEICHLVHIKEPPPADGGALQQNPGSAPTRRTAAHTDGAGGCAEPPTIPPLTGSWVNEIV
ncbi:MAG: hypothetical protein NTV22_08655 [bacterium]|nr:hypothetical protein [bacterium]